VLCSITIKSIFITFNSIFITIKSIFITIKSIFITIKSIFITFNSMKKIDEKYIRIFHTNAYCDSLPDLLSISLLAYISNHG
jgi:hypothetical protein